MGVARSNLANSFSLTGLVGVFWRSIQAINGKLCSGPKYVNKYYFGQKLDISSSTQIKFWIFTKNPSRPHVNVDQWHEPKPVEDYWFPSWSILEIDHSSWILDRLLHHLFSCCNAQRISIWQVRHQFVIMILVPRWGQW